MITTVYSNIAAMSISRSITTAAIIAVVAIDTVITAIVTVGIAIVIAVIVTHVAIVIVIVIVTSVVSVTTNFAVGSLAVCSRHSVDVAARIAANDVRTRCTYRLYSTFRSYGPWPRFQVDP